VEEPTGDDGQETAQSVPWGAGVDLNVEVVVLVFGGSNRMGSANWGFDMAV
jgi:hypothetical protein